MNKYFPILSLLSLCTIDISAQALYFKFDNSVDEHISGTQCNVEGVRTLPFADGISGKALHLDGYSNYVSTKLSNDISTSAMTFSMWIAAETYPMMNVNEAETSPSFTLIAGNLDEKAKTGFGLMLSSQGDLKFKCFLNSWQLICTSDRKIPVGKWSYIVATVDQKSNRILLFVDGNQVGSAKCPYEMSLGAAPFMIGKSQETILSGPFIINTFNGLIDELRIDNQVFTTEEIISIYSSTSIHNPQFNSAKEAFANNILRPQFHGMPSHAWTNECHGLTYYNGKYHLFFQKNANGPYMARLHWGHLTSTDLLHWTEATIAIVPSESYDIKGCWSGCIFSDAEITNNKPFILYTGVDNAKARICMASPTDEQLTSWQKNGVIIDGRPSGLSDDFRDPYFFSANGEKYIVVGTSKDNIGACTLHKYNPTTKQWTNNGDIFFRGTTQAECGRFWEMPVVVEIENGKYLFCCTPLETSDGVKTLYWIGTIAANGTFVPENEHPQELEMKGASKHGYGLLSPTIWQHNGQTMLLGIVPDKVSSIDNYNWGWAHNYSLPRQIELNNDGTTLQQKFVTDIQQLRNRDNYFSNSDIEINGEMPLGIKGYQIEMCGTFTYRPNAIQGFRFLQNGDNYAALYVGEGKINVDLTNLERIANDNGVYNGIYSIPLPSANNGDEISVRAILDGSILDVFVNDNDAFSVRLFPTNAGANSVSLYSNSPQTIKSASVYSLTTNGMITRARNIAAPKSLSDNQFYNLLGQRVSATTKGLVISKNQKRINL
ncbi:MAG: GH32 C-terminal domain-containing protein [Bacteroidales bacterium]|nr:GH32 C-terminal domain-containing protein [Bacteroidales bacterium]